MFYYHEARSCQKTLELISIFYYHEARSCQKTLELTNRIQGGLSPDQNAICTLKLHCGWSLKSV